MDLRIDGRGTLRVTTRRAVLQAMAAAPALAVAPALDLVAIERPRLQKLAAEWRGDAPRTIVSIPAPRSAGGPHDYYSEADYWWPDPAKPSGPFLRRDGETNPAKFDGHRDALIAFGRIVPALTAAWLEDRDADVLRTVERHLHAWLVDPATRMNPSLKYAQAIIGRDHGRAIGIIDTLQIVEVARALTRLRDADAPLASATLRGATAWFSQYLAWLTNSDRGREEREQTNNHGTCWLLQVAAFAQVAGDRAAFGAMRNRLVEVIVPAQVAREGRQPLEIARTKPFGYSLFNMDVLATAAQLLGTAARPLWQMRRTGSGSVGDAVTFMAPFIADRARWPYRRDIAHFTDWPVRHPALLFAGRGLGDPALIALWQRLDPDPIVPEVVRNFPIRQPLLWS